MFIWTRVEIPDLAGQFGGDDAIGREEGVRERRLSVILGDVSFAVPGLLLQESKGTYYMREDTNLGDCQSDWQKL